MNITLAYDLDDTLIRDGKASVQNTDLLLQLQEYVFAVPVTARPHRSAKKVLPAALTVSGVYSGGAEVVWQHSATLAPLPELVVDTIWTFALHCPTVPLAFESPAALWCNPAALLHFGTTIGQPQPPPHIMAPKDIIKVLLSPEAEPLFANLPGQGVSVLQKREGWKELMKDGVTKASGLTILNELSNNGHSFTISLGDDINDIPTFKMSDYGVAMSDAVPEVLAIANAVTHSEIEQDHDEVYKLLQFILALVSVS